MKKVKIIYVIFLFLLAFISHFIYQYFPNFITSLFFPVNESIWEHMKIIYSAFVLGSFFERFLLKHYKVKYHNFNIETFVKAFLGVISYLIIYLPLYFLLGENIIISIILLLMVFFIMEIVGTKILTSQELSINILPIITIILGYFLFFILTYYPPHCFLFFDSHQLLYGIKGS